MESLQRASPCLNAPQGFRDISTERASGACVALELECLNAPQGFRDISTLPLRPSGRLKRLSFEPIHRILGPFLPLLSPDLAS